MTLLRSPQSECCMVNCALSALRDFCSLCPELAFDLKDNPKQDLPMEADSLEDEGDCSQEEGYEGDNEGDEDSSESDHDDADRQ